jgi:acyl-coenzyme A synthetase/AMP-(fatty) acid ligase
VSSENVVNPFLHLQANAEKDPQGIFSQSADQSMTNAEALVSVKQFAFELRRLGVKAGEIVALDLPDQLSILVTEAVYHEAAISTALPEGYVADGGFRVDWLVTNRPGVEQPGARTVLVDRAFLQHVGENPYGISPSEEPIEILRVAFSSGTTGRPRAIPLGRAMERSFDAILESWFQGSPSLVLMDTGTAWGLGEFYLSVKTGRPFLCVGNAPQEAIVRIAAQNDVHTIKGSAAQVAALVDELEAQGRTLPSVQTVIVGGTVMPPGVAARLRTVTEGCSIFGNYGSTEAGGAASRFYDSDDPFDAGRILPGSQVEIVDENDRVVPMGVVGRIRHRSAGMAQGYLGDDEATARAFRDGWFYPGDLGYLRPDGGLTLTGRESEVFNAGGVKIDPSRIDHLALESPAVKDACSFEFETASGMQQIGLALVTDDGADLDAIVAGLKAELGSATPTLVVRIGEIPRNQMGKPLRRTLAERYGAG